MIALPKSRGGFCLIATLLLQVALVVALAGAGWLVYQKFPERGNSGPQSGTSPTTLQIVLRASASMEPQGIDIPVELYPIDIVAVRHEYFTDRQAGKRFEDFLNERMDGRFLVTARLDKQGQASVVIPPGNWWVHAVLSGDEDLEWRLPINVVGSKQTVELTPQNAYARTRSF